MLFGAKEGHNNDSASCLDGQECSNTLIFTSAIDDASPFPIAYAEDVLTSELSIDEDSSLVTQETPTSIECIEQEHDNSQYDSAQSEEQHSHPSRKVKFRVPISMVNVEEPTFQISRNLQPVSNFPKPSKIISSKGEQKNEFEVVKELTSNVVAKCLPRLLTPQTFTKQVNVSFTRNRRGKWDHKRQRTLFWRLPAIQREAANDWIQHLRGELYKLRSEIKSEKARELRRKKELTKTKKRKTLRKSRRRVPPICIEIEEEAEEIISSDEIAEDKTIAVLQDQNIPLENV